MWRLFKSFVVLLLIICGIYAYSLYKDHQTLNEQVIRLHVVADTDDPEDQKLKLQVRDEILRLMDIFLDDTSTKEEALQQIREQLPVLQDAANSVIRQAGKQYKAVISLQKEAFPTRDYDTFSLPAGVYDSLRLIIGSGEGQNWWCVVFPELCIPVASTEVKDVATSSGFSYTLSKTLVHDEGYEVRFWLLDLWGRLQNTFLCDN